MFILSQACSNLTNNLRQIWLEFTESILKTSYHLNQIICMLELTSLHSKSYVQLKCSWIKNKSFNALSITITNVHMTAMWYFIGDNTNWVIMTLKLLMIG